MACYIRQLDTQLRALRQTAHGQQDIRDQTKLQPHLPARPLPSVGDKVLVRAAPPRPPPRWLGPHEIILTSDTCACASPVHRSPPCSPLRPTTDVSFPKIYDNFYRHGVAFNTSDAICIPARDKPDEIDAFYNAWLEVLPGVQTLCLICMSEHDPRPTCLWRAEAMDLGGCMFGTMCAMPEDLASDPAFDAFTLRDLSVCGYYEPTNAAVISLYLCFPPAPTTPPPTMTPEILPCPSLGPGPVGGLVLWDEGEALYDNVRHEVVPVLVNISGIQVPDYCTAQVRNLYAMMGKEVIERAIDTMGATHYRTDIHNTRTQRHRRDIVNDALTRLNTGTSVVNSLDIQGLNKKIEKLKGVMRDLLQRSLTNHADQALLGEEGAYIQLDGIAVLETHAHTINHLIDRERENTAHIHEGQLCHAYALWMVAQIRYNLDQVQRGEVPDWIDSAKLASLAERSGPLDSRTLKGMTRVYPVTPDCEVSEATGVRIVLLIPVVTPGSGPFPLFHIENIVIIQENASLKYRLAHHTARSQNGAVYGVTLTGCKRRGAITICPHPL
ncbi:hypothetical protein chiPu_0018518 [Chiloscyllium punctatum]|uniref:Uncharacterized protein n=1 Tax=Chiloscyllium punctatum TaxID=137246 RepID=A0A401RNU0_CHIPU|nr:hypothetical protein [Chiloscyllium punctatum]